MKSLRTWALDLMMALFFAALGLFLEFGTASAQTVDTWTGDPGLWNGAGNYLAICNGDVLTINGSTCASEGSSISEAHPACGTEDCGAHPQD